MKRLRKTKEKTEKKQRTKNLVGCSLRQWSFSIYRKCWSDVNGKLNSTSQCQHCVIEDQIVWLQCEGVIQNSDEHSSRVSTVTFGETD
jgi:hypothetical protein